MNCDGQMKVVHSSRASRVQYSIRWMPVTVWRDIAYRLISISQYLVQENMVSLLTGFDLDLPPSTVNLDHCLSSNRLGKPLWITRYPGSLPKLSCKCWTHRHLSSCIVIEAANNARRLLFMERHSFSELFQQHISLLFFLVETHHLSELQAI